MKILIKNGTVVRPESSEVIDILIENEKIIAIEKNLSQKFFLSQGKDENSSSDDNSAGIVDKIIDATDKIIFPGGIDPHTHFDIPMGQTSASDDFASGTRAAAIGGTTCIIDFANQKKGNSVFSAIEKWHKKAYNKAVIDYSFHVSITDISNSTLTDMEEVFKSGLTSFKLFSAYPGVNYLNDAELFLSMQKISSLGGIALIHAENGLVIDELIKQAKQAGKLTPDWHAKTRPALLEAEATARTLAIALTANCPAYIVHLTNSYALEEVKRARARIQHKLEPTKKNISWKKENNPPVFAETCPQYLLLDDSLYTENFESAKWILSPPLRQAWHKEHLWQGLENGDLQSIATDHCSFNFKGQKDLGKNDFTKIPNGIPGVENRFALMYTEAVVKRKFSLQKFAELIAANAAKIFGLYPEKGVLAKSSDADIVIFNPDKKATINVNNKQTHNMNVDYNAFEGMQLQGMVETVLSRGEIIVQNNKFTGQSGRGKFLKRKAFNLI